MQFAVILDSKMAALLIPSSAPAASPNNATVVQPANWELTNAGTVSGGGSVDLNAPGEGDFAALLTKQLERYASSDETGMSRLRCRDWSESPPATKLERVTSGHDNI